MRRSINIFVFFLCSLSAFAQPTIVDTSRIHFFDPAKSWNANCAALKTYMFPSLTGSSGKYLTSNGTTMSWGTVSGAGIATDAFWAAKGDMAIGTGNDAASVLSAGTDGMTIYYDADEATGIRKGPYTISPTQLTSDQDDYNPTGLDEAQIVRMDGDNGIRAITSMAATFSGDTKTISNIGSYPIYFPGEHPDGTAANRFAFPRDLILMPGESKDFWYDGTSSRWRVKGFQPSILPQLKGVSYSTSYGTQTGGNWGDITIVTNSGTITGTDAATGIPGHWLMSTSTSSSAGPNIYFPKTSAQATVFADAHLSAEALLSIPTLSDPTERCWTYFTIDDVPGTTSASGTANNNTVGIRYYHGTNSGKWELFTRNNSGTESTADSGITVTVDMLYLLRIEVDKSKTEVRYYINNSFVGRITSNLPNSNTCSPRIWLQKTAGTTARTLRLHAFSFQAIYP